MHYHAWLLSNTVKPALPAMASSTRKGTLITTAPTPTRPNVTHYVTDIMGDTGAGRNIGSKQALMDEGIPDHVITTNTTTATTPVTFDTANGTIECNDSVKVHTSSFGNDEIYMLEKSPLAMSIGQMVMNKNMPFIWNPPELPYFVTNPQHLSIMCEDGYKHKADRIEDFSPYFNCLLYTSPSPRDS